MAGPPWDKRPRLSVIAKGTSEDACPTGDQRTLSLYLGREQGFLRVRTRAARGNLVVSSFQQGHTGGGRWEGITPATALQGDIMSDLVPQTLDDSARGTNPAIPETVVPPAPLGETLGFPDLPAFPDAGPASPLNAKGLPNAPRWPIPLHLRHVLLWLRLLDRRGWERLGQNGVQRGNSPCSWKTCRKWGCSREKVRGISHAESDRSGSERFRGLHYGLGGDMRCDRPGLRALPDLPPEQEDASWPDHSCDIRSGRQHRRG